MKNKRLIQTIIAVCSSIWIGTFSITANASEGYDINKDIWKFRNSSHSFGDTNRPIVQRSTREELHQLFDKRSGTYRAHASHVIPGGVSPEEMAERIMAAVNA